MLLQSGTSEIKFVNGGELSAVRLNAAAVSVSRWLIDGQPNTKPKSAGYLLETAGNSTYAFYGGDIVGHIALRGVEPLLVKATSDNPELSVWNGTSHFRIESLIAARNGMGLGSELVSLAISSAAEFAVAWDNEQGYAVVSAIAAVSSQNIFRRAGLADSGQLGINPVSLPSDFDPASGKQFMIGLAGVAALV